MDRPGSATTRGGKPKRSGDLQIVFEDNALIVLDKPAGLLAVPLERRGGAPSIFDQVAEHLRPHGKRRPLVVHRIDRDTSGLVVFAKEAAAQNRLKGQFKRPHRGACVSGGRLWPSRIRRPGTWRDRLVWDQKALIQKQTHPRDRAEWTR